MILWQHVFHYLNMGGFGDYVWSAFAISFVVLLWLFITSFRRDIKVLSQLKNKEIEDASHS